MNIKANLELHFYDRSSGECAISPESFASSEKDKQYCELLLATNFILRTLSNLGPNSPVAEELVGKLAVVCVKVESAAAANIPQGVEGINSLCIEDGLPDLVDFQGLTAKRRILSTMKLLVSSEMLVDSIEEYEFTYKPKGFGVFNKSMDYYAPASVVLLIKYLCEKRSDNDFFAPCLMLCIQECVRSFIADEIRKDTCHLLAGHILDEVAAASLNSIENPLH